MYGPIVDSIFVFIQLFKYLLSSFESVGSCKEEASLFCVTFFIEDIIELIICLFFFSS